MKSNVMFAALLSLLVFAFGASAQDKASFSGTWTLDVGKSKLGDHNMIESQTITVAQSDKDLKVETVTKRVPPPADAQRGGSSVRGQFRGSFGSGDGTAIYSLEGKETKTEMSGNMGSVPVLLKAKLDGGKLKLSRSVTFHGPIDDFTMTTSETWELSSDGKTLTVNTERSSPRGSESSTKVFIKKG
jgi:hypothetical protein